MKLYLKRYNFIKILELVIILILFPLFFSKVFKYKLTALQLLSEIKLTIKGKGNQYILSEGIPDRINYQGPLPDQLFINGDLEIINSTMIYNLKEEYNNITLIWNSPLITTKWMFNGVKNITKIVISSFDSTKLKNMKCMFCCIDLLTSIDLSIIDTSLVINYEWLFFNCTSLISLDLSNFITSNVASMYKMFENCKSLIFLNLKSFTEESLSNLDKIFDGINNIITYCIDKNKAPKITSKIKSISSKNNCLDACFLQPAILLIDKKKCISCYEQNISFQYKYNNECVQSCPKRTRINLYNNYSCEDLDCHKYYNYNQTDCLEEIPKGYVLNDSSLKTIDKCNYYYSDKCFSECIYDKDNNLLCKDLLDQNFTEYLTFCFKQDLCIYCYNGTGYYPFYNNSILNIDAFNDCYKEIDGYFFDYDNAYKPCFNTCKRCSEEGNETNNFCLECKDNYIFLNDSQNGINNCYGECPKDFPYKSQNDKNCEKECNATDLFNGICIINNKDSEIKDEMINNIRSELFNHNMDELLKDVIDGKKEDLVTVQGDIIYTLTTSDNQNSNEKKNESTIYLGECENKLKTHYNISVNDPLLIFKIDIFEKDSDIPIIEYEIYNSKTKEKLDLIYCKDTTIKINIPAKIDKTNEFKYNPVSDYYKDICFVYTTEDGTDINLSDRKNEFFDKNLCESNCDYEGYNSDIGKAACDCQVKIEIPLMSEIVFNKELLKSKFVDIKNYINLKIMKCYYILFTSKGLLSNIGSYTLFAVIFLNIILLIAFISKGHKKLCDKIYEISKSKGIMNNSNIIKTTGNSKIKKSKKKKKKKKKKRNNSHVKEPPKKLKKRNKKNDDDSKAIKLNSSEVKFELKISKKEINCKNASGNNISILNSNIVQSKKSKYKNKNNIYYNDYEFNGLSYTEALKADKRTYSQYYFSVLRMKYLLVFTFIASNDYNSKSIKICLFLFIFSLYFTINTLFFNDSTMHEILLDKGNYNFIYQIPQIIYSSIISSVINSIISYLSLTERSIVQLKKDAFVTEKKVINLINCLKVKFFLFFVIDFSLLLLFWYYLSCFCAVYKNAQIHLIKDTLISFGLSLLYPLLLYLIPGVFRIMALRAKNANRESLYKISKILQLI